MKIVSTEQKEVIQVLHRNAEEMHVNVEKLESEGWSPNTRVSLSGLRLIKEELRTQEDVQFIRDEHPEIEIQYPKARSYLSSSPYVIMTTHERVVE